MLILRNYIISNNKEKIISATIEEGDDIVAVTFFAAKPQKKGKFAISLQQSEEGDGTCRLLLQYKVPTFFAMQLLSRKMKGKCSYAAPHQVEEGLRCAAITQEKKNKTRRRQQRRLLRCAALHHCAATLCSHALQRSVVCCVKLRYAALRCPATLRCNVAQQRKKTLEEGAQGLLRCSAATQRS